MSQELGRIVAVCTANICRSPAIERLLAARLPDGLEVRSAGTHAVIGAPIAPLMAELVDASGARTDAFVARQLTPHLLADADLVLVASHDHRTVVARLAPRLVRRTFMLRELARLLAVAGHPAGTPVERLRALPDLAGAARLRAPAGDDDVVDPFGRPPAMYRRSFGQILPAVETLAEALGGTTR